MIAQTIRNFFDSLFPHRVVLLLRRELEQERRDRATNEARSRETLLQVSEMYKERVELLKSSFAEQDKRSGMAYQVLEAQLAERTKERDYFRGRAERLELRILPDPIVREKKVNTGQAPGIAPRKRWAEVQAEASEKLRQELAAEKEKENQKASRIDAPKPIEQTDATRKDVAAMASVKDRQRETRSRQSA